MRNCRNLDGKDPRYDPTVIPISQSSEETPESSARTKLRAPSYYASAGRFRTVQDFHEAYASGSVTPTDVVEALLPLIRRDGDVTKRSPSTAFMESRIELIRQAAEASTQRWKKGQPLGTLDGVPFAVKDDLEVEGYKRYIGTTHDYTEGGAKDTSWCVKKVEEEGAILVGKLNMHELGMGEWRAIISLCLMQSRTACSAGQYMKLQD